MPSLLRQTWIVWPNSVIADPDRSQPAQMSLDLLAKNEPRKNHPHSEQSYERPRRC